LGWQFGTLDRPESSTKYSSKLFRKHLALLAMRPLCRAVLVTRFLWSII